MKIEIQVSEIGIGKVVIDGRDVSMDITGFTLDANVGELTRFTPRFHVKGGDVTANAKDVRDTMAWQQAKETLLLYGQEHILHRVPFYARPDLLFGLPVRYV